MSVVTTDGCWVGFDLGGTKMLASVFDHELRLLGKKRKKTKTRDGRITLARIAETIREALADAQANPDRLSGIGIGVPGPLDLNKGVVIEAVNLGWKNVAIQAFLEDEFHCPVVIANDVDAGVYGEYRFGAAKGARCVVGVFPGTGVGGGCVYEGKILRGRKSSCMEIGHIQVMPDGPLCGCGQQGCLETVASRLAVSAAAAKAAYRGEAPHLFAAAGTDLANIRSGALAASIAAGDTVVRRIVADAAAHIGIAVAGIVNLLAPDVVVLGGGLVEALPELVVGTVDKVARERVMPSFGELFKVVAAKLGDDAAAMGAAAWIRELTPASNGVAP